jgi:hypothetical protein
MTNIKFVQNLFNIAVNLKPKRHVNNGTRAHNMDIINKGCIELQKMMISYECLRAAVMLSKDNKSIAKKAEELMTVEIEGISGGGKSLLEKCLEKHM